MISLPKGKPPILVVDDEDGLLLSMKTTLISAGMPEPALVSDSRLVMDLIREHQFRVVLLDLNMPHVHGMDLLRQIKEEFPAIECIIITAVDKVSSATEAMKIGAYDYIVKPIKGDRLIIVIDRAIEKFNLRQGLTLFEEKQTFSNLENPEAFQPMIAEDEAMARVFRQAEIVAPTDYNVVIAGESGTGKEMLANIIHSLSRRSKRPFLAVNMASFSRTLFEDEFFGHNKGAFTDAVSEREGFFEKANRGTLFLDEITELELSLQAKLLRVIEEKEFYRLGSTETKNIDVRLIAATNRNINEEIKKERFRADLFYRLNTYSIRIPPLKERKKDIMPLVRHFLNKHAERIDKRISTIDSVLRDFFMMYAFPGNIRELNNIIAAAVLLESGKVLTMDSARSFLPQLEPSEPPPAEEAELLSLADLEKRHITRVLKATDGNRKEAAHILGINTTTVYRKIEKYDISL